MNRTARHRGSLALLLTGALFAGLPVAAAEAESPIDPALPTPTIAGELCGSETTPAWYGAHASNYPGVYLRIGIPQPTVNGRRFQGAIHAWDADGSPAADGSDYGLPMASQDVYVPLSPVDGHSYRWYASTYDGTAYSEPTTTCSYTVDTMAPAVHEITNPDFPRDGSGGKPRKAAGQPTTFTFSGGENLPGGCTTAAAPDCQTSGLDHFEYTFDEPPYVGAPQIVPDRDGRASVTATSPWGTHTLYVVAVDAAGNHSEPSSYSFFVPDQPPPPATPVMTLTAPKTSAPAHPLTVTGRLSAGPYDAGQRVRVVRKDLAHLGGVALPEVPLGADGSFRFTDTPTTEGPVTYTVNYRGDATHRPAGAAATVQVARSATQLSLTTDASTYSYGATATVTAHLGPTRDGRTVAIYAQPRDGLRTLVRTGRVDAHGNLRVAYRLTRNTAFTAVFTGGRHDAPATATRTVHTGVKVAETQRGYYRSARYGSTLYRVYHRTAKAELDAAVSPGKARQCLVFRIQRYDGHAWHTLTTTPCHALSRTSTANLRITLTHAVGGRFRVSAGYVHSAKDDTNLSTWGAWQYFTVTR